MLNNEDGLARPGIDFEKQYIISGKSVGDQVGGVLECFGDTFPYAPAAPATRPMFSVFARVSGDFDHVTQNPG